MVVSTKRDYGMFC